VKKVEKMGRIKPKERPKEKHFVSQTMALATTIFAFTCQMDAFDILVPLSNSS